jgi:1-acyl-sn-glycerol-3-phosphate acyltransferase
MERINARQALMTMVQWCVWLLSRLLRLRFDVHVRAPAHLFEGSRERRIILAPTHRSLLDPWLLAVALNRQQAHRLLPVRILATQTFNRLAPIRFLVRLLYRISGVIALPPRSAGGTLEEKTAPLLRALESGDPVVIFPEGHVRRGFAANATGFARGVVYVHRRSCAPIVPVAIQLGSRRRLRRRCLITFGPHVNIPAGLDLEGGAAWLRRRTLALRQAAPRAVSPKVACGSGSRSKRTLPRRLAHGTRTH